MLLQPQLTPCTLAGSKADDFIEQCDIPSKSLGAVAHPEGVPEASASERHLA